MSRSDKNDSREKDVASSKSVPEKVILATMADTTWRMFVPTVGFTLLGVACDRWLNTKPWLMFVGIVLGIVFAVLLVLRQINGIKR